MAPGDAIQVQRQEQVGGQEPQTLTELLSFSAVSDADLESHFPKTTAC
jgi:hypothetical protein